MRGALVQRVVEAALGRRTEAKERSQMRKSIRDWYTSQAGTDVPARAC